MSAWLRVFLICMGGKLIKQLLFFSSIDIIPNTNTGENLFTYHAPTALCLDHLLDRATIPHFIDYTSCK